jgi:transcriptional regulator with XRE-family HTH domain
MIKRGPGMPSKALDTHPRASGQKERILSLRLRAGMSRRKLAELSGFSPAGIWFIETGRTNPRESSIKKLLVILEPPPDKAHAKIIRCRWCGTSIVELIWEPHDRRLAITDKPTSTRGFEVRHGYFYHQDCLEEKTRTDKVCPDEPIKDQNGR